MARTCRVSGHLTVFWHRRVKREPALALICQPDMVWVGVLGCGIGEIWVANCVRLTALILALGAVSVFQCTQWGRQANSGMSRVVECNWSTVDKYTFEVFVLESFLFMPFSVSSPLRLQRKYLCLYLYKLILCFVKNEMTQHLIQVQLRP